MSTCSSNNLSLRSHISSHLIKRLIRKQKATRSYNLFLVIYYRFSGLYILRCLDYTTYLVC